MAPFSICNILLCCLSYNISPHASHHYIPSQPRQKPSASVHCTNPALQWTVPFDLCRRWFTLCDLGSKSSRGIPLSPPLHIHNSAFVPSSSSSPFFAPVSFLPLPSLLLLTTLCTPAQPPQPKISVVWKPSIWSSTSRCTGRVSTKQSATLPSCHAEFVVCEMYADCMHLLKSSGWFAS